MDYIASLEAGLVALIAFSGATFVVSRFGNWVEREWAKKVTIALLGTVGVALNILFFSGWLRVVLLQPAFRAGTVEDASSCINNNKGGLVSEATVTRNCIARYEGTLSYNRRLSAHIRRQEGQNAVSVSFDLPNGDDNSVITSAEVEVTYIRSRGIEFSNRAVGRTWIEPSASREVRALVEMPKAARLPSSKIRYCSDLGQEIRCFSWSLKSVKGLRIDLQ